MSRTREPGASPGRRPREAPGRDAPSFRSKLFRWPGPGGWTFAPVPLRHAPPVTSGWGRTPVLAEVDGTRWETSVWRDRKHGTLLPVPKRIRGDKGHGDTVSVRLLPTQRALRPRAPAPRPPG